MHPGEPILIICHAFPPIFDIGGRRWAKFAKELARRGHPVHVIRSSCPPGAPISLWDDDVKSPNIIAHALPDRYPLALTRWPAISLWDKLSYRFWKLLLPLCTKGNWYDRGIFWRKPMLELAGKLINEHGIRNVIVTGAPFSLMAYATALKRPFPQINLVADFRDVWTWGTDYGMGTMAPKRLQYEKDMEALVARMSDRLISPHATIVEHLRNTYGGIAERYVTLPHAIDPDDLDVTDIPKDDGVFKMIYAGSLYGAEEAEHYFDLVLQAFQTLKRDKPAVYANSKLDLYITGHGTEAYERKAKASGQEDRIHFHAPLPPKEIFKRLAQADLVLTFIPSMNKDILGTKFNEIFHLRRPILHIGEPGMISRTIVERKLGDTLRLDELVSELPRIISGDRPIEIDRTADHSENLLVKITDRLFNEVLV